jgi:hypothetical protein
MAVHQKERRKIRIIQKFEQRGDFPRGFPGILFMFDTGAPESKR